MEGGAVGSRLATSTQECASCIGIAELLVRVAVVLVWCCGAVACAQSGQRGRNNSVWCMRADLCCVSTTTLRVLRPCLCGALRWTLGGVLQLQRGLHCVHCTRTPLSGPCGLICACVCACNCHAPQRRPALCVCVCTGAPLRVCCSFFAAAEPLTAVTA